MLCKRFLVASHRVASLAACGLSPYASRRASSTHANPPRGTSTGKAPDVTDTTQGSDEKALQRDDNKEWLFSYADRAVMAGRHSAKAADYFKSIVDDQEDFREAVVEARRLMGGQDPEKFTPYQQGQFADRLSTFMSRKASARLMRAQAEESNAKRYTQDGTPTGENYWFEAGNVLASPGVPTFVKDEILEDMQRERKRDSPAFEEPQEEAQLEKEDNAYAEHVRRSKRHLFQGSDL